MLEEQMRNFNAEKARFLQQQTLSNQSKQQEIAERQKLQQELEQLKRQNQELIQQQ